MVLVKVEEPEVMTDSIAEVVIAEDKPEDSDPEPPAPPAP